MCRQSLLPFLYSPLDLNSIPSSFFTSHFLYLARCLLQSCYSRPPPPPPPPGPAALPVAAGAPHQHILCHITCAVFRNFATVQVPQNKLCVIKTSKQRENKGYPLPTHFLGCSFGRLPPSPSCATLFQPGTKHQS